eukprot:scaffold2267_cov92-Cylindrotheca_fusiformis.AAC.15
MVVKDSHWIYRAFYASMMVDIYGLHANPYIDQSIKSPGFVSLCLYFCSKNKRGRSSCEAGTVGG